MATISGQQNEKVFQIKQWLGLNESPDGDTKLKLGEANVMRNWRVTRDGNLQKRPGSRCVWTGPSGYCSSVWHGTLKGDEVVLAVVAGKLYEAYDGEEWATVNTPIGTIDNTGRSLMFEFDGVVYIYGNSLYSYDGTTFSSVTPYIPVVMKELGPSGTGNTAEQVNKLTSKRRVWLSPDNNGTTTFQLPETGIHSIVSAKLRADDSSVPYTSTTATDLANGQIVFDSAPAAGTDTIEVTYQALATDAVPNDVYLMTGVELYNGDQLNRVFMYGNDSNQAYYSGINGDTGKPDPSYIPDLNVVSVGDENEPILSMIRYNSRLICFKQDSTWTIQYGQMTLANGSLTAAFYVTPVHSELGGEKAQMVMNSPVVVYKGDIYSWRGNDYGNMTADERQASRISDRIHATLSDMYVTCCYDDNYNQEYYVSGSRYSYGEGDANDHTTLVWNYARDVWYLYNNIRMNYAFSMNGKMYYGIKGGSVAPSFQELDPNCHYDKISTDEKQTIDCYWAGGSESFGVDYQRKYSAMLWVGIKPMENGEVWVTVKTDRSGSLTEKMVYHRWVYFDNINFGKFSFNTSHRPKLKRLKIKAKKFVYYKLIFYTNTNDSGATITTADIRVRFTGYAK